MNKKIVITGTSGTGKSSVIYEMKKSYNVIDEVARALITKFTVEDQNKLPWNNREFFQDHLEGIQLQNYFNNPFGIYDRSFVDEIAYRNFFGMKIPSVLYKICENLRFDSVFFMEFWKEIYVSDSVRIEKDAEALQIETLLKEAYINCGYDLVIVPKVSIEDRVKFITTSANI